MLNFAKYIRASYRSRLFYPMLRGFLTTVHSIEVKKILNEEKKLSQKLIRQ